MRITLFSLELPPIKTQTQAPLFLAFPKLGYKFLSHRSKAQILTYIQPILRATQQHIPAYTPFSIEICHCKAL
jgi:hypothetical protein